MAHIYYFVFNSSSEETIEPFKIVNREEQVLSFYPYKCLTIHAPSKSDKFEQLFDNKEELIRFFLQFNYAIIKKLIDLEDSLCIRYVKKKMGFKDLFMRMVDETLDRFLCHLAGCSGAVWSLSLCFILALIIVKNFICLEWNSSLKMIGLSKMRWMI